LRPRWARTAKAPTRRQRGETCVRTKWTIPPRRSLKTIFVTLRREPLRTQVRVVCSFATGCATGAKTRAAARSSALNRLCSAGVGAEAAEADAEPVAVPVPEPPAPVCEPEPEPAAVLVPGPPAVAATFDEADDTAEETLDFAEVVVCPRDDVTLLKVETTVETTDIGFGGGGGGGGGGGNDVDVGSGGGGTGSGTVVDVGSGTLVLVGSGTEVLVGSGGGGGPTASAIGAATAAAAAQSRIDLAHRGLIWRYNRAPARTVAVRGAFRDELERFDRSFQTDVRETRTS
jgi:hypothetical protein